MFQKKSECSLEVHRFKSLVCIKLFTWNTMIIMGIQDKNTKNSIKSNYCLTKYSIRAKRSISRIMSLFIIPSPFIVHCPKADKKTGGALWKFSGRTGMHGKSRVSSAIKYDCLKLCHDGCCMTKILLETLRLAIERETTNHNLQVRTTNFSLFLSLYMTSLSLRTLSIYLSVSFPLSPSLQI